MTTQTKDVFVNLEMDNGEGFIFLVKDVPQEIPTYYRWYRSETADFDYDGHAETLLSKTLADKRAFGLLTDSEARLVSLQAVDAFEQSQDLKGMTWEEGVQWALDNNFIIRKVVEDGKTHVVTMDLNQNRWSCRLSNGKIYRAERY